MVSVESHWAIISSSINLTWQNSKSYFRFDKVTKKLCIVIIRITESDFGVHYPK